MPHRTKTALVALLATVALVACGNDNGRDDAIGTTTSPGSSVSEVLIETPTVAAPDRVPGASGEGSGADEPGDSATADELSSAVLDDRGTEALSSCAATTVCRSVEAQRADGRGMDLAGVDLAGADLAGADLSGADLLGASLRGANLTGALLVAADLSGADLRQANLDATVFEGASLDGAQLEGAFLCGTVMPDGAVRDDDCDPVRP